MSNKNFPKFPPLEIRFLAAFVNMYYIKRTTAVYFFLPILMFVCYVIYQERKVFLMRFSAEAPYIF